MSLLTRFGTFFQLSTLFKTLCYHFYLWTCKIIIIKMFLRMPISKKIRKNILLYPNSGLITTTALSSHHFSVKARLQWTKQSTNRCLRETLSTLWWAGVSQTDWPSPTLNITVTCHLVKHLVALSIRQLPCIHCLSLWRWSADMSDGWLVY